MTADFMTVITQFQVMCSFKNFNEQKRRLKAAPSPRSSSRDSFSTLDGNGNQFDRK
tara:strand:- start:118 stop:285 length:168 start_codon:yes stop_codon:yes gene_type:complete